MLSNCAIICKFINANFKTGHWGTESTSQALSKSATRGTTMLLTVSFAFILLTGPIAIIQLFFGQEYPYWVFNITLTLQYMNHGINGILYCIAGSRFRNELNKIFVSWNANYQRSSGTTVLSSNCEDTWSVPSISLVTSSVYGDGSDLTNLCTYGWISLVCYNIIFVFSSLIPQFYLLSFIKQ